MPTVSVLFLVAQSIHPVRATGIPLISSGENRSMRSHKFQQPRTATDATTTSHTLAAKEKEANTMCCPPPQAIFLDERQQRLTSATSTITWSESRFCTSSSVNSGSSNDDESSSVGASVHDDERHLGPYDVICGREKCAFNNIGNRRFRVTVALYLDRYMNATTRKEKSNIVKLVARTVQDNGGRFLQSRRYSSNNDDAEDCWVVLSTRQRNEKTGHALRDMASARQRSTSGSGRNSPPASSSTNDRPAPGAASAKQAIEAKKRAVRESIHALAESTKTTMSIMMIVTPNQVGSSIKFDEYDPEGAAAAPEGYDDADLYEPLSIDHTHYDTIYGVGLNCGGVGQDELVEAIQHAVAEGPVTHETSTEVSEDLGNIMASSSSIFDRRDSITDTMLRWLMDEGNSGEFELI
jgi:hypothetical protein